VNTPSRNCLLLRGQLDSGRFIGNRITPGCFDRQSPPLIWLEDRAGCMGSEIDVDSTVVGGSQLIDGLLTTDDLEAWPIRAEDSLGYDADQIN
jgi:hypothetical protein